VRQREWQREREKQRQRERQRERERVGLPEVRTIEVECLLESQ